MLLIPAVASALEAPVVTITCEVVDDTARITLSWEEVAGATHYAIYGKSEPYETGEFIDGVIHPPYSISAVDRQFYHVIAKEVSAPPGFTLIPAGSFMMGSNAGGPHEQPVHRVTLTHDFYLGTHEVTNEEYRVALQWAYDQALVTVEDTTVQAYGYELLNLDDQDCEITFSEGVFSLVAGTHTYSNGQYGPGYAYPWGYDPADHPVKEVTWYGAACYCDWMTLMSGEIPFYNGEWDQTATHNPYFSTGYRLPTEAEWEYAARYKDERTYPWGEGEADCDYANFFHTATCVGWTAPVGSCPWGASHLGLMDMAGNVNEWTGDGYDPDYYEISPQYNPLGHTYGLHRVLRSCYWQNGSWYLRCSVRGSYDANGSHFFTGFRVALTAGL